METFSALLAICAGNSPEFPTQRPVTRSFGVSLICVWIKGWVNNREAGDLGHHRGHYDVIVMYSKNQQKNVELLQWNNQEQICIHFWLLKYMYITATLIGVSGWQYALDNHWRIGPFAPYFNEVLIIPALQNKFENVFCNMKSILSLL